MEVKKVVIEIRRAIEEGGRHYWGGIVLIGGLALPAVSMAAPPTLSPEGPWAKGRIIVIPKAGLGDLGMDKIAKMVGGKATRMGNSDLHVVELPAGASEKAAAALLAHNPHLKGADVDHAEFPQLAANDPYSGSAWHLIKIGATNAWNATQGYGVTVAVLDSGVDSAHPDLSGRLVPGWNFYDNNNNTADVYGHGTKVAGSVAAVTNNGIGVASVAGQAKIMPLRVTDTSGIGYSSMIANAVIYAADRGVRVANISFANQPSRSAVVSAASYMKSKGGLVFVAAGNSGVLESFTPTTAMVPVAATGSADARSSFSSYGSYVSLSAPGQSIYSTVKGGTYGAVSGTSFASPVAAAVAALVMSAKPTLTSTQVESILFSTAVDLGTSGHDIYYGHGRVDAEAAVLAATGGQVITTPTDTTAPQAQIAAPLANSTVIGATPVDVSATDNVGVTKVELRVNGTLVATDTSTPFAFSWDTTKVANGMASLVVKAYDAAGNAASSAPVAVNVANPTTTPTPTPTPTTDTTPPTVKFVSPGSSVPMKGGVIVSTSASDNAGTSGITQRLYINGALVATATGGSLSYTWNANKAGAGTYTLNVVANDAARNTSSTTLSVRVSK